MSSTVLVSLSMSIFSWMQLAYGTQVALYEATPLQNFCIFQFRTRRWLVTTMYVVLCSLLSARTQPEHVNFCPWQRNQFKSHALFTCAFSNTLTRQPQSIKRIELISTY
jgi:hypothetical protein